MSRNLWACEACGWEWPLATEPPAEAECDSCGGPLEKVDRAFVAVIDTLETVAPTAAAGRVALRPILEAAKWAVDYHTDREEREYPGYVWIEWADLVRFVEAFRAGGSKGHD